MRQFLEIIGEEGMDEGVTQLNEYINMNKVPCFLTEFL